MPALNFEFQLPQVGAEIFVSVDVSDDTRMLVTRLTMPPQMFRQFAQAALKAADAAEKKLVKPQSGIATA